MCAYAIDLAPGRLTRSWLNLLEYKLWLNDSIGDYVWINDRIVFTNAEDLIAFKIRFGV